MNRSEHSSHDSDREQSLVRDLDSASMHTTAPSTRGRHPMWTLVMLVGASVGAVVLLGQLGRLLFGIES